MSPYNAMKGSHSDTTTMTPSTQCPARIQTERSILFYSAPEHCASVFSTDFGKRPKRAITLPLQPPVLRSDYWGDVNHKASELQRKYPDDIWDVRYPQSDADFFNYFDAQDIHDMGPSFLLDVLWKVVTVNEVADALSRQVIDEFAADWVADNYSRQVQIVFRCSSVSNIKMLQNSLFCAIV